eukprot:10713557-Ditylum_brightwellii.AAC.1
MANNDAYSFTRSMKDELKLADCFGVFEFYFVLKGDSWQSCDIALADCDGTKWGEGDHCEWVGILPYNEDGHISLIEFATEFTGGDIGGTIPQELYIIDQLENFIIEDPGSITRELPDQFGMMASMTKVFNVAGQVMVGTVPDSFLTFSPLESLLLGGNQLTGKLPTKLAATIKELSLEGNVLTSFVPDELFILEDLKILDFLGLGMNVPLSRAGRVSSKIVASHPD